MNNAVWLFRAFPFLVGSLVELVPHKVSNLGSWGQILHDLTARESVMSTLYFLLGPFVQKIYSFSLKTGINRTQNDLDVRWSCYSLNHCDSLSRTYFLLALEASPCQVRCQYTSVGLWLLLRFSLYRCATFYFLTLLSQLWGLELLLTLPIDICTTDISSYKSLLTILMLWT